MKITGFYVRVSSERQDTASQLPELKAVAAQLEAAGETIRWYEDHFTGKTMKRPDWQRLESDMRSGVIGKIVIWRTDRLGRTTAGLSQLYRFLIDRGIDFRSLRESFDLLTPAGRLTAHVVAAAAEYETEVRHERVRAGIAAAKAEGRTWGGYQGSGIAAKVKAQLPKVKRMHTAGIDKKTIATACGLDRGTISRLVKKIQGEAVTT